MSESNIIKKKKTVILIMLTSIIIFLTTNIVYAKYISTDKITSLFKIAKPIFIIEGGEIARISRDSSIGYYEFSIKNFNENEISEIGFEYTIEIISKINEAVKFELYNEENNINLVNLKTEKLLMKGNQKIEEKYHLKIILDDTKLIENEAFSEIIEIKIDSEQKKI